MPNSQFFRQLLNDYHYEEPITDSDLYFPPIKPQTKMTTRTLLSLVKKYKKNPKYYLDNYDTTYFWRWLWATVQDKLEDFNLSAVDANIYRNNFIRVVSKYTNTQWVYCLQNYKIYPAVLCTSYWGQGQEYYLLTNDLQDKLRDNIIVWDEDENCYMWANSYRTVYSITNGDTIKKQMSNAKDQNKYFRCICSNYWLSTNKVINPETEEETCPSCASLEASPRQPQLISTILGNYHSHKETWKFKIHRLKDETSVPMGLEVEVQSKLGITTDHERETAWAIYQAAKEKKLAHFYFEEDGSLADGGFEMITDPMTLEYHKMFWEQMLPVIKYNTAGWDKDKWGGTGHNYGIHITMSRKYWSDLMIARLTKFLDLTHNCHFVWSIAQRTANYNGSEIASKISPKIRDALVVANKKLISGAARNKSVNLKAGNKHMEIRMFACTLNKESFIKNLEFLDAFHAWCKETAFSIKYEDFLIWLGSRMHHKYRYEHLISYLSRPKFYIKGNPRWINNTFSHLIKSQRGQLDLFGPELNEDVLCV